MLPECPIEAVEQVSAAGKAGDGADFGVEDLG
jgi:hypothetical protein